MERTHMLRICITREENITYMSTVHAEIFKVAGNSANPCLLADYHGTYTYGGIKYIASAFPSGASMKECRELAFKALKVNESTCTHMKCIVECLRGGYRQKNLFVASFFFDSAAEAGFVDSSKLVMKVIL